MKYNKSEIMKQAWSLRKLSMRWVSPMSFGECLRRAWRDAKRAVEMERKIAGGRVELEIVAGAMCTINTITGTIGGETFKARKALKAAGLRWDPECRQWYGDRQTIREFCRQYA